MQAYTPEFILVGIALVLLLADAFLKRIPKGAYGIIGALATLATLVFYTADIYTNLYPVLALISTALTLLLAVDFRSIINKSSNDSKTEEGTGEFFILPLIACAGITAMCKATDLVTLFVSLEVLTLTSYILVGYFRRNLGSLEASAKYLILGAISTAILVFGMAWYFGMTGTFQIGSDVISATIRSGNSAGLYFSLALLLLGGAFKIGAVPMQMWIPDVYQGAPTPVTAFLSVTSKVAGFAFLTIILTPFAALSSPAIIFVIALMTAATLLVGNLGAIAQNNMKRLLGYSSIAQAGFILPFFLIASPITKGYAINAGVYLAIYMVMTFGAFFALAMIRTQRGSEEISAFRGLGKTNPRLAFAITVMFASLAGTPLTAGFLAKMASFMHVIKLGQFGTWLLPIMIICAATGFYYYFKVIRSMYWEKPLPEDKPLRIPRLTAVILTAFVIFLLVAGIMPLFVNPMGI
ncbi:MAG: NADH-quinone oxidoreductase subunit N [Akkermansia sp.]